jgi:hypothetical protein
VVICDEQVCDEHVEKREEKKWMVTTRAETEGATNADGLRTFAW